MTSKDCESVLEELRKEASPSNRAAMARFGISSVGTLGVPMPKVKAIARRRGRDHGLAQELWGTGIHEARILAGLMAEPTRTDRTLMERWVRDFDSWDVCDQVCSYLFSRTRQAYEVVPDWTAAEEEFVRRAGFVMMAALAVHDKRRGDEAFLAFFPLIERGAGDDRNFVKKAVNWSIRQMGKRNLRLRTECLLLAERVRAQGTPNAKWIAADAIRELSSPAVISRLKAREARR